jgi:flagellar biosynthesis protein FlhG
MEHNDRQRYIWAIGGGKGGIGKTFVTANLGIALSERRKQVILVDADLGGANLHNLFGIPYPHRTLDDFMRKEVRSIEDVIMETEIPHLRLISGSLDILTMSNPKHTQKQRVIRHIRSLDADYIIIDLGAGTSYNVLDFFLISERGIFIVTPEPTSLENAYRFLRGVFFRKLRTLASQEEVKKVIALAMDRKNPEGIRTPYDLLERVEEIDRDTGLRLQREIGQLRPRLIVNQIREQAEGELGYSVRTACRKYFGIDLDYLGSIAYDPNVYRSIRKGHPFLLNHPVSDAARCVREIASHLIDRTEKDWAAP